MKLLLGGSQCQTVWDYTTWDYTTYICLSPLELVDMPPLSPWICSAGLRKLGVSKRSTGLAGENFDNIFTIKRKFPIFPSQATSSPLTTSYALQSVLAHLYLIVGTVTMINFRTAVLVQTALIYQLMAYILESKTYSAFSHI